MLFDVVYSYDCNVLRAQSTTDPSVVRFVHFMITGRKLKPYELEQVANREFGNHVDKVKSFTYLIEGQGCPGTEDRRPPRRNNKRNNKRPQPYRGRRY